MNYCTWFGTSIAVCCHFITCLLPQEKKSVPTNYFLLALLGVLRCSKLWCILPCDTYRIALPTDYCRNGLRYMCFRPLTKNKAKRHGLVPFEKGPTWILWRSRPSSLRLNPAAATTHESDCACEKYKFCHLRLFLPLLPCTQNSRKAYFQSRKQ